MHKFIPLNMPSSEWVVSWVIGIRKQNVHCYRRSGAALNCRRKLEKVQQALRDEVQSGNPENPPDISVARESRA